MVLYELICLTRAQLTDTTVREIAKTAGATVINNGGVVRSIEDWGHRVLPKPIKKYQSKHDEARYFLMRFDTNPRVQKDLSLTIKLDPRVLRHSVVKLGERLDQIQLHKQPGS
ncbi:protein of unknown function [Taphrina deformans PYCC 5710]|uniref:37S ribosomal protein Mrp17 n=1 Tax=Taphrina deformans (strain PYCC 5710 / ATCC 11124 / CBS 356.35 / IMI 108563 / JCM 9778 / NBRC 8474) TaxID=1097556 RepID=R4XH97_TAPDE|nr:protein of unknown function [Taphrina deformans PYCC 5710]|eukprot:CCG83903.1 protein of unknown function [Taphrina deformans PYCC 5710]